MNTTAQGNDYEDFVEELYQALLDAEGFEKTKVEKNKTNLVSSSGCNHQIDLYWEFQLAGQMYRTAIECKAYNTSVPIGRVRDFYGVLADIPGLQGVLVSLVGFQSGAKKYAKHYGIGLKEIREPMEEDWEGRVKNIELNVVVIESIIRELNPNVTEGFRASLKRGEEATFHFQGTTHDSLIVDNAGGHVASYEEIRSSLPTDNKEERGRIEKIPFVSYYYNSSNGGRIPIDSVTVHYDVKVDEETIHISGEEAAKAIMKDALSGDLMFFDREGGVRGVR